jgi:hypothetical protein
MAVTAQEQASRESSPIQPARPARPARQRPPAWPSAATLRQSAPIIRLLGALWAIPEVVRVGLLRDGAATIVHVVLSADDRKAQSMIHLAELDYLRATPLHDFDVRVTPLPRVPGRSVDEILAGFESIIER